MVPGELCIVRVALQSRHSCLRACAGYINHRRTLDNRMILRSGLCTPPRSARAAPDTPADPAARATGTAHDLASTDRAPAASHGPRPFTYTRTRTHVNHIRRWARGPRVGVDAPDRTALYIRRTHTRAIARSLSHRSPHLDLLCHLPLIHTVMNKSPDMESKQRHSFAIKISRQTPSAKTHKKAGHETECSVSTTRRLSLSLSHSCTYHNVVPLESGRSRSKPPRTTRSTISDQSPRRSGGEVVGQRA